MLLKALQLIFAQKLIKVLLAIQQNITDIAIQIVCLGNHIAVNIPVEKFYSFFSLSHFFRLLYLPIATKCFGNE